MNNTALSRAILAPASLLIASAVGSAVGSIQRDGSTSAAEPTAMIRSINSQAAAARYQQGNQDSAQHLLATSATAATAMPSSINRNKKSTSDGDKLGDTGGGGDGHSAAITDSKSKLIFLGSGSSTGCPKPLCTMLFANEHLIKHTTGDVLDDDIYKRQMIKRCKVSSLAIQGGDPKSNKNYRNNPSFLIHHYPSTNIDNTDSSASPPLPKNIIIDVGKTFREGALRWFPHYNIRSLDAIILTHHHMDAAAGLDDVRGFQRTASMLTPSSNTNKAITGPPPRRVAIPIYMSQFCYDDLSDRFPWLLPRTDKGEGSDGAAAYTGGQITNDPKVVVKRDVASFDVQVVDNYQSFHPAGDDGLKVTPLPVWHGDDLISLGFSIIIQHRSDDDDDDNEQKSTHVVYLSDISRMVPETMEYIQRKLPPTDILVVDSLLWHRPHPVHYSLDQAIRLAQDEIRPKVGTYLIGMSCDDFLDHDSMNHYLQENYPHDNVQFAYDGLAIEL